MKPSRALNRVTGLRAGAEKSWNDSAFFSFSRCGYCTVNACAGRVFKLGPAMGITSCPSPIGRSRGRPEMHIAKDEKRPGDRGIRGWFPRRRRQTRRTTKRGQLLDGIQRREGMPDNMARRGIGRGITLERACWGSSVVLS
jgi:hypothetical protein